MEVLFDFWLLSSYFIIFTFNNGCFHPSKKELKKEKKKKKKRKRKRGCSKSHLFLQENHFNFIFEKKKKKPSKKRKYLANISLE
jgi:hypothetical protein